MKRKEEVTIIIDALCRSDLLDPKRLDEARGIVKGALTEIRCRKYAAGQVESPKEIMENVLSDMREEQQTDGKNPLTVTANTDGKRLFRKMVDFSNIPTCDLVEELQKRGGVEAHTIGPSAEITVKANGPAIVLVVVD